MHKYIYIYVYVNMYILYIHTAEMANFRIRSCVFLLGESSFTDTENTLIRGGVVRWRVCQHTFFLLGVSSFTGV